MFIRTTHITGLLFVACSIGVSEAVPPCEYPHALEDGCSGHGHSPGRNQSGAFRPANNGRRFARAQALRSFKK
jgi:hypothetical protein